MESLQRMGGLAALVLGAIYVMLFVIFGAVLNLPATAGVAEKLAFLLHNQSLLMFSNLLGYVAFGVVLAVLVLALHERLKAKAATLSSLAAIFGVVWVGLVMASGMVANIGLTEVATLATEAPEQAMAIWQANNVVVEGLGGGNEIVGGVWLLLLSAAALKAAVLPRALSYFGLLVGGAGVLTIYPAELFTEIFGLSQILWFFWLGIHLLRRPQY